MRLFPVEEGPERKLYEGDLDPDPVSESQARSSRDGREFDIEAFDYLEKAGATIVDRYLLVGGYRFDALVEGVSGKRFLVAAHGSPDRTPRAQAGMRRQDTALKFGYRALILAGRPDHHPLLLLTSHMPTEELSAAQILRDVARAKALWDAVQVPDLAGFRRLQRYFGEDPPEEPLEAPWRQTQLSFDDIDPLDELEVQ